MPIPRYDGWILGEIRNFDIHEVLIPLFRNGSNEHSGLNHFSGPDRFTYVQFRLCVPAPCSKDLIVVWQCHQEIPHDGATVEYLALLISYTLIA